MASSLWINGGNPQNVSPGATRRATVGTTHLIVSTGISISPAVEVKLYDGGTISHLGVHVTENTAASATVTVTLFKNGIATALTLTIPAGTTGYFLNSTDLITVAVGDTIYIRYVHSSVFDNVVVVNMTSVIMTPEDSTRTITQVGVEQYAAFLGIPGGGVRYMALHGTDTDGSTSQSARQDCVPIACTMRNARIYVADNPLDGPAVFTLQVNGVDTGIAITVGTGLTGFFEATGVDVAVAAHDLVGWEVDCTGATSGLMTVGNALVQFHSTAAEWFLGLGQVTRAPSAATTDLTIGGLNFVLNTQAEQQFEATLAGRCKGLCINVRTNVAASDSTLRWRTNGANGTTVVTIPAGQTGFFDAAGPDTWAVGDLLSLRLTMPVGGDLSFSTVDWIGSFEEPAVEPESQNAIDCPHGAYYRTIIGLSGSARPTLTCSDGSYRRTVDLAGSF